MASNEERREIAARLRDYDNLRELLREAPIGAFFNVLGVKGYMNWKGVCNLLADLIEPEPERTYQIDTSKYKNGGTVSCGVCGKRIPTKSRNTETVEAKYPRCPWCGVKVQS